jgi:glycosyltransferase involved in cell wall biosynthesis
MMRNMSSKISDALLEKLLWPGSRLRCAYETGLKGAGVIANEGCVSFFKKLNVYLDRNYMQPDLYARWIEENEDNSNDHLSRLREACYSFKYRPRFSIVFPVFNTENSFLKSAIDSVLAQAYDNWELCAVDGNSTRSGVKEALSDYSSKDDRIKVAFLPENEGIAGNSNRSLQMATGEYVAFLDHDDELSPLALFEFARILNDDSGIDIIYSDEDKIDTAGKRFDPMFKPDWSPDMLRSCNYISHFLAVRRDLALQPGGFRKEFEGAQDYDFLLRAVENAKKIRHTNKVLYHWRSHSGSIASNAWSKGYAHENGKKALQEHCRRLGKDVVVQDGKDSFCYNVRYRYDLKPMVSIILAAEGRFNSIRSCLESILDKTTYRNYEILVVDASEGRIDRFCLSGLDDSGHHIKWLEYCGTYNRSAANNLAAKSVSGDMIIFLDECMEVVSPEWIESLIEHAQRGGVGAAGGMLVSPQGRLIHAGLVMGLNGGADYICAGMTGKEVDVNPAANLMVNYVRNVSAVNGGCLCLSKEKFFEAGGFNENNAGGCGYVQLCLRLQCQNYFNIYTPFSILSCRDPSYGRTPIAVESVPEADRYLRSGTSAVADPYYSENFDRISREPMIRVNRIE